MNTSIPCPNYNNHQLSNEACTNNNNNESVHDNHHNADINERIKTNVIQRQAVDERINRPFSWQSYGWCNTDYTSCNSKKNDDGYRNHKTTLSNNNEKVQSTMISSIDPIIMKSQQRDSSQKSSSSGSVTLDTNNSSIHKSVSMSSLKTMKSERIRPQSLSYYREELFRQKQQKGDSQTKNKGSVTLDTAVTSNNNPIYKSLSVSSLSSSLPSIKTMNESIRPQSPCYDREALYLTIRRDLRMLYSLSDDNETESTSSLRRRKDSYIDQSE